ncbi:hypothetical protein DRO58_01755 [Candidatus Bathyarchaeota archaeon]|nr:MAG: hypothetical protein DRO58_01755 [Candidatus Bathyarchaeota archaeon]
MEGKEEVDEVIRKLVAIAVIPLILLTLTGMAYTHWADRVEIIGVVETGKWRPEIGSYKIVTPVGYDEENPVNGEISEDKQSLLVTCANVSEGWNIWVGLIIANEGTIPVEMGEPGIYIRPLDQSESFNVEIYLYGPYDRGGHTEVWGGVKMEDLPFEGNVTGSIILNPSQKAVVWIEFTFEGDEVIDEARIIITIR